MRVSHDSIRHLYRLSERKDCWSRENANRTVALNQAGLLCRGDFYPGITPSQYRYPSWPGFLDDLVQAIEPELSYIINPSSYSESLLIERLSITFTSYNKREFVPRDQVSLLLVAYCSLFLHTN